MTMTRTLRGELPSRVCLSSSYDFHFAFLPHWCSRTLWKLCLPKRRFIGRGDGILLQASSLATDVVRFPSMPPPVSAAATDPSSAASVVFSGAGRDRGAEPGARGGESAGVLPCVGPHSRRSARVWSATPNHLRARSCSSGRFVAPAARSIVPHGDSAARVSVSRRFSCTRSRPLRYHVCPFTSAGATDGRRI